MDMLLGGIKVGLILSFMIGPIFFALVQTSVEEGFRAGAMVALGIWVSDTSFVLAVYYGVSYLAEIVKAPSFSLILGIAGSILLACFGLATLLTIPKGLLSNTLPEYKRSSSYLSLFIKGFFLNFINIGVLGFWLAILITIGPQLELKTSRMLTFFTTLIITYFVTDIFKILLAKQLRNQLNQKNILLIFLGKKSLILQSFYRKQIQIQLSTYRL